jgi:hypothetical protein
LVSSQAFGVGSKDENSLSQMRRADLGSREQIPLRIEPEPGQVAQYGSKSSSNKPRHVLQQDRSGLHLANDLGDAGPEPAVVFGSLTGSCGRPRLAGEPGSDEIHSATPGAAVEGGQVSPDRARIQMTLRHARCQYSDRIGLPLDHADRTKASRVSESQPERESTVAGAELEDVGGGMIHINGTP